MSPLSKKFDVQSLSFHISSMRSDTESMWEQSPGKVTSINGENLAKKAPKSVHFHKIEEDREHFPQKYSKKQALELHELNFEIAKVLAAAVRKYKLAEQKERAMMRGKIPKHSKFRKDKMLLALK